MTAATKVAVNLALLLLLAIAAAEEGEEGKNSDSANGSGNKFNCTKRPEGFRSSNDCCDIPTFHFEKYEEKCRSVITVFPPLPTSCLFECLFNVSESLTGHILNLPQVHSMMQVIFPSHDDFVAAYYKSFEECSTLIKQKMDEFKLNQRARNEKPQASNRRRKCMPFAYYYAMCAHVKMLQNCPAHAWHSTKKCMDSRAYLTNCQHEILNDSIGKRNAKPSG